MFDTTEECVYEYRAVHDERRSNDDYRIGRVRYDYTWPAERENAIAREPPCSNRHAIESRCAGSVEECRTVWEYGGAWLAGIKGTR